jgi:hypothetical protein
MKSRPLRLSSMITIAVLAIALGFVHHSRAQTRDQLYGTWRLMKFQRTIAATGETIEQYGKAPLGFLNYGRDGRMMTIVVGEGRSAPSDPARVTDQERANLYKTMFAYAGTFSFDGKTITHHVDVSYNQFWTGTDLVRQAKLEGNKLTLTIKPEISAADGRVSSFVLLWEKVK